MLKLSETRDILDEAYKAVNKKFAKSDGDEFILPVVAVDDSSKPIGRIKYGDTLFFVNFRTDRPRELVYYFSGQNYEDRAGEIDRSNAPNVQIITMTQYDSAFNFPVVLQTLPLENTYGEAISKYGIRQIRRTEDAKIKHVTYFFNGEKGERSVGETHGLIPSQKVETYNLAPEMRAKELCDAVIEDMAGGNFDEIILNLANADMLGHTGDIPAAIKGIECVDVNLGRVVEEAKKQGFLVVITSDHGNAEQMLNKDGSQNTAHTTNLVPFIIIGAQEEIKFRDNGNLTNIAPTLFHLRGLEKPQVMDQESLIVIDNCKNNSIDCHASESGHPEDGFMDSRFRGNDITCINVHKELKNKYTKIITIILDGWGIRKEIEGNAIAQANTPNMDNYLKTYPNALLKSSEVPSSETGHKEIGAGRKLTPPRQLINDMINNGLFFNNATLREAMLSVKKEDKTFHILGLLSDGNIHSSMEHWFSSLKLAKELGLKGNDIALHAFLDGRDTPPRSAKKYIEALEEKCAELGVGALVDLIGRYWAMDRENKWDRIKLAADALIEGKAEQYMYVI